MELYEPSLMGSGGYPGASREAAGMTAQSYQHYMLQQQHSAAAGMGGPIDVRSPYHPNAALASSLGLMGGGADSMSTPAGLDVSPPSYTTDGSYVTMQLGVPDLSLGALLGHGGRVIKEIMQHTGTQIKVSQKDVFLPGTAHRGVRVTGALGQVQQAKMIIFQRLQEDAVTGASANRAAQQAQQGPPMSAQQAYQLSTALASSLGIGGGDAVPSGLDVTPPTFTTDGSYVTMQLGVPDLGVGALLGHGGRVVKEIMQHTGTQIKVSQKDVFLPGTAHRAVRVTGALAQVQVAKMILFQRLQEDASTVRTR